MDIASMNSIRNTTAPIPRPMSNAIEMMMKISNPSGELVPSGILYVVGMITPVNKSTYGFSQVYIKMSDIGTYLRYLVPKSFTLLLCTVL